ncbi:MAG: GNAT family N-acetyltransferase [Alphaproteobacteria bacterium]|nr:GNAT family N-acetyltransferase [Alphaproteobacteria bacterium]
MDQHHQEVATEPNTKPNSKRDFNQRCKPISVVVMDHRTDRKTLAQLMWLHRKVYKASNGKLKLRKPKSVLQHLQAGHKIVAANSVDSQIIGFALLAFPEKPGATNIDEYRYDWVGPKEDCMAIQTVCVDPFHQGCGVTKLLFEKANEVAKTPEIGRKARRFLLAKISEDNSESRGAFASKEFIESTPDYVGNDTYRSVFVKREVWSTPVEIEAARKKQKIGSGKPAYPPC